MSLLISQLFFETANAVSHGINVSKALATSRTISKQIASDAELMIPPNPSDGGVLCIINKEYSGVPYMDARKGGELTPTDPQWTGVTVYPTVRSDQLLYMADLRSSSMEPLTPQENSSFSSSPIYKSNYARIWYGHLLRVADDGIAPEADLGQVHLSATPTADRLTTNWLLGRQALFFYSDDTDGPPGTIYAQQIGAGGAVTGYSPSLSPIPETVYSGISDVAYFSFNTEVTVTTTPPVPPPLGPTRQLVGTNTSNVFYDGMADSDYRTNMLLFTFANERLRAKPMPSGTTYEPWRIAQMHPILASGVPDFIVQFAADAEDGPEGAPDGVFDDEPDVYPTTHAQAGEIIWYDIDNPPTWSAAYLSGRSDPKTTSLGLTNADHMYKFRHDEPELWPYMIRIRYRLQDPKGELETIADEANRIWLPGIWYEQIIRVRRD